MRTIITLALLLAHAAQASADSPSVAVNAGLIQPIVLGGANVDVRWRHLVVSYSHGWSLDLEDALGAEMTRQHVSLHVPYTTGVGIGGGVAPSRLRSLLDVRVEAKVHGFSAASSSDDGRQRTRFADDRTYTLGAGVYWALLPFRRGINLFDERAVLAHRRDVASRRRRRVLQRDDKSRRDSPRREHRHREHGPHRQRLRGVRVPVVAASS